MIGTFFFFPPGVPLSSLEAGSLLFIVANFAFLFPILLHSLPGLLADREEQNLVGRALKSLDSGAEWVNTLFDNVFYGDLIIPDIKLKIGALEENVLTSSIGQGHIVDIKNHVVVGKKANGNQADLVGRERLQQSAA